ncbi:glycoside hydrolase family 2 protein [Bifidobacterium eulemuris]|uniref:Beta-galactosidase n=1 Tax=Bifidobacterium eulemuris TaxID=1765219 RepID=A0A7L9SRG3_9BIFI|nr:glycoside hydrolase family 2 TIM barrel-domain containing protein [Bifidobacterium eulemuris]QOL32810.1 hypothetical protein BE0216_10480 [Bifidobacterium eulemuris]
MRDNALKTLLNHGAERRLIDLTQADWMFSSHGGSIDSLEPAAAGYDDSTWTHVTLPHTWNAEDTCNGVLGDMRRTVGWYRTHLNIDAGALDGRVAYLEFLGANTMTSVYVNGIRQTITPKTPADDARDTGDRTTHLGGYAAFRVNIGSDLHEGDNVIAVRVDNRFDARVAPLFADFDFYGGIYREAYLVIADTVHIDLDDYGSSGLYVATPNAGKRDSSDRPEHLGRTVVRARLVNNSDYTRQVVATVRIAQADGAIVVSERRQVEIAANDGTTIVQEMEVDDPHLWRPIDYSRGADRSDVGYQYTVLLQIADSDGNPIDSVVERIGYRWFHVDPETGFHINGVSHPLRGVARHQEREGVGNCLTNANHLEDIRIALDLGANYLRLAHYPHANYFYDLCDANGIVVWAEIPFVDWVGEDPAFANVTCAQMTELVRQQFNRPSICFWGLQNEVGNRATSNSWIAMPELMERLDSIVHQEDPTRYTTQATDQFEAHSSYENWSSDLISWNIYPSWYMEPGFGLLMDKRRAAETRPLGVSEYGAGANIRQHALHPTCDEVRPNGSWHPEEFQCDIHEEALAYINTHPWIWSSSAWSLFDFSVDHRPSEAGRFELNNKGLVTRDRRTRKDAFYLYKANWNHADPFVHLVSKRYHVRAEGPTDIRIYSNTDRVWVKISHDGMPQTKIQAEYRGNGVFVVPGQMQEPGIYTVWAYGSTDGCDTETVKDSAIWTRLPDNTVADDRPSATEIRHTGEPASIVAHENSGFTFDTATRRMVADRELSQITPAQWEKAFEVRGDGRLDFHAILPANLTPADYALFTDEQGNVIRIDVVSSIK